MTARSNYHNFHFLLIVRLLKCHYLGRPCESNCTSMKNLDVLAFESICISLHIQMYQILHKCGKSLPHIVESILHIMWNDPATLCGRLSFSVSFGQFIQFFWLMFLGTWNQWLFGGGEEVEWCCLYGWRWECGTWSCWFSRGSDSCDSFFEVKMIVCTR